MNREIYQSSYRPDIDGLRAIAVLLVVGFHAFPTVVHGGFIGVDIFFVISGYLISLHLFEGLFEHTFSFKTFYSKRIKRIAPALLLVLTFSLCFSFFALLPDELEKLGKQVVAGSLFVSNFLLLQDISYFAEASESNPLLHLWSLAVEEQFYLIWPITLVLLHKKRLNLLTLTIFVACVSFYLNVRYVNYHPAATFYLPISRLWELLIGSILAYNVATKSINTHFDWANNYLSKIIFGDGQVRSGIAKNLYSLLGASLLISGLLILDPQKPFPGMNAVYPVVGSILLIMAGTTSLINKTILSNRALVYVGLISYPLYLWHWPLLSFARIMQNEPPAPWIRVGAIVIAFLMAHGTYSLIEKPVRRAQYKKLPALLLLSIFAVGISAYVVMWQHGFESRYPDRLTYTGTYERLQGATHCVSEFTSLNGALCQRVKHPKIAIIGDSHSGHLFYGFLTSKDPALNQPILLGAYSCAPAKGLERRPGCSDQLERALSIIESTPSIKTAVLVSYYDYANDVNETEKLFDGYLSTIKSLQSSGKRVIVMLDTPSLPFEPNTCFDDRPIRITTAKLSQNCEVTLDAFKAQRTTYYKFMERLKLASNDVLFFDPSPLFFKNGIAHASMGKDRLFYDKNHLTIHGSTLVASGLTEFLKEHISR